MTFYHELGRSKLLSMCGYSAGPHGCLYGCATQMAPLLILLILIILLVGLYLQGQMKKRPVSFG